MSEPPASIDEQVDHGTEPNYLVRRLLVTAAVVAAIAIAAVVIGRLIDGSSSDDASVDVDTSWNRIVTINERTGRITTSRADGSDEEGMSSTSGPVSDAAMIDGTVFIAGSRTSLALDLRGGQPRLEVSDLLDGEITLARPAGTTELVMFSDGSDAVFVGSDPNAWIDTSQIVGAPGVELSLEDAKAAVDGSAVLLPDLGNFQSVLVRFGDEPASYFAGAPLAVDEDRVATVQNVGRTATVTVSTHDGMELFAVTSEPVLAAMLVDDGIMTVDSTGIVHRINAAGDEPVGALGTPPTAGESWVTVTGDRLVVTTARGISVLDESGEVLTSIERAGPATTGPAPASSIPLRPGCQPTFDTTTAALQLVNVRNGELVGELDDSDPEAITSADGCVAVAGSGTLTAAITSDGADTVGIEGDEVIALSPDGATIVVDVDGRLVAVPLVDPERDDADDEGDDGAGDSGDGSDDEGSEDDGSDTDDLGPTTPYVFFAEL